MVGQQDPKVLRPLVGEFEAMKGTGTVQKEQRLSLASRVHDDLHTVDGVDFPLKRNHVDLRCHSAAASGTAACFGRRRGNTSSAINERFFTAFQCGILPRCPWMLKCVVPISRPHSPIWLATFSAVPTAMKDDSVIALKSNEP